MSLQNLFGKKTPIARESFDTISFMTNELLKMWAEKPTAIALGRAIIMPILYFFQKNAYFDKK